MRPEDKLLLSRQEPAVLFSISQRSLDYLIPNKVLTVRRIGSRVSIPVQDLQRFTQADHPLRSSAEPLKFVWEDPSQLFSFLMKQ